MYDALYVPCIVVKTAHYLEEPSLMSAPPMWIEGSAKLLGNDQADTRFEYFFRFCQLDVAEANLVG